MSRTIKITNSLNIRKDAQPPSFIMRKPQIITTLKCHFSTNRQVNS